MEEISIPIESVIKIEEIKQEAEEHLEDLVWNSTEQDESSNLKIEVKKEDDEEEELEPPARVFLEPKNAMKDDVAEEFRDPLAMCSEDLSVASPESTGSSWFPGAECIATDPSGESQTAAGSSVEQSVCGCCRPFSSEGESSAPALTNTGAKSLECSKCKTSSAVVASKFPAENDPKDTYLCSVCQKSFTRKTNLVKHMRTHTGETLHHCYFCQMTFNDIGNLVYHLRIHTGERPYECSICQKGFKQRDYLANHMRNHTDERPFECSICQKSFKRNRTLAQHMRIHTGQRPFQCSVCQKSFSRRGHLIIHLRIHAATST